jgi:hypothetical protein
MEPEFTTRDEMSSQTTEIDQEYSDEYSDDIGPYRAVSKAAVFCFIFSFLSLTAWLSPILLLLPGLGIIAGLVAWAKIRRYPNELTGRTVAWIGVVLCGCTLVGGTAWHSYVYATEVPPDCLRISFADLQPESGAPPGSFPRSALELDGKKVFIKGYLYPDGQQYDIKRFVLIPDMGTCCFGGQPALTDMIEVTLQDPLRVDFARRKRKFAGVLSVDGTLKPVSGLGGVVYQLDADYVK